MGMQSVLAQTKITRPKVSVIVPVYNNEDHIDECLQSIVDQTLQDIEIIVINDGSTDRSRHILHNWTKEDSRIQVINQVNKGTGASINYGISIARGEYIAEVDGDDFIDPDMYEYLYSIADGADIVKSGYYSYYEQGRDYPYSLVKEVQRFCPIELDIMSRFLVFSFQPSFWSAIYRREFIWNNNLYWNETPGASFQDTSIIFKMNALCKSMVWTDRSFYHWRVSEPHSITSNKWPYAVIYEYACMENFLEEHIELQLPLRAILSKLRDGTYSWNASRLVGEEQKTFIEKAAADFQRDNDYQDIRFYMDVNRDTGEMILERWFRHEAWRKDPDKYYELLNKAIAEAKHDKNI